jgi:hypothetical protein
MTIQHSEGVSITGVCRIDHINTKIVVQRPVRDMMPTRAVANQTLAESQSYPQLPYVASAAACKPCSAERVRPPGNRSQRETSRERGGVAISGPAPSFPITRGRRQPNASATQLQDTADFLACLSENDWTIGSPTRHSDSVSDHVADS